MNVFIINENTWRMLILVCLRKERKSIVIFIDDKVYFGFRIDVGMRDVNCKNLWCCWWRKIKKVVLVWF